MSVIPTLHLAPGWQRRALRVTGLCAVQLAVCYLMLTAATFAVLFKVASIVMEGLSRWLLELLGQCRVTISRRQRRIEEIRASRPRPLLFDGEVWAEAPEAACGPDPVAVVLRAGEVLLGDEVLDAAEAEMFRRFDRLFAKGNPPGGEVVE